MHWCMHTLVYASGAMNTACTSGTCVLTLSRIASTHTHLVAARNGGEGRARHRSKEGPQHTCQQLHCVAPALVDVQACAKNGWFSILLLLLLLLRYNYALHYALRCPGPRGCSGLHKEWMV